MNISCILTYSAPLKQEDSEGPSGWGGLLLSRHKRAGTRGQAQDLPLQAKDGRHKTPGNMRAGTRHATTGQRGQAQDPPLQNVGRHKTPGNVRAGTRHATTECEQAQEGRHKTCHYRM